MPVYSSIQFVATQAELPCGIVIETLSDSVDERDVLPVVDMQADRAAVESLDWIIEERLDSIRVPAPSAFGWREAHPAQEILKSCI
jgi:hypothetical protein